MNRLIISSPSLYQRPGPSTIEVIILGSTVIGKETGWEQGQDNQVPSLRLVGFLTGGLKNDIVDTWYEACHFSLGTKLPTISAFYGILIQMFWRDHAPPHFHALYAEFEAQLEIGTLEIIAGKLPNRALALVLEWAAQHRGALMEDWKLCEAMQRPKKIPPLE